MRPGELLADAVPQLVVASAGQRPTIAVAQERIGVEDGASGLCVIRAADPNATVVCPGMGNLWDRGAQTVLREFANLGGYDYCDVAGVKLHQRSAADPPETMLDLLHSVDQIFHSVGVHPRIWNTGTTYSIALEKPLDTSTASNYAARFFLIGLYGRDVNLERMYFYNWGGTRIPIVLPRGRWNVFAAGSLTPKASRVGTGWQSACRTTSGDASCSWIARANVVRVRSCGRTPGPRSSNCPRNYGMSTFLTVA